MRVGLNLGPFDAWLTLRGVRTLALRMERHSANALELARFLATRSEVARVHYPGLPEHPQHALARKLLPDGFGGMLSFDLAGGAAAVGRLPHQASVSATIVSHGVGASPSTFWETVESMTNGSTNW